MPTEQQHTREPWYIQAPPWPPMIRNGREGFVIAEAKSPYTNPEYRTLDRANGERIVACVNAMSGVDDPAALRASWEECVEALQRYVDQYGDIADKQVFGGPDTSVGVAALANAAKVKEIKHA